MAVRKAVALAATMAALVTMVACSNSAPSSSQFANNVDGICRALGTGLGDLSKPSTVDDLKGFADDASHLFASAVTALKKLQVPSGSSAATSDAKTLVSNFDHLVDVLDDIATASRTADQATIDDRTTEFESVRAQDADLADSLDAKHCDLDPLFDELAPPVTDPPVTDPATTTPITASTDSNKTTLALAAELVPVDGLTFTDVADNLLTAWTTVLDNSPITAASPGRVAGVEVSKDGTLIANVYIFLPTDTVKSTSIFELANFLTQATVADDTVNGFPGLSWTTESGVAAFVGAQTTGDAGYVMYALSPSHDGLVVGITGLWASLPK
ncbi:unannotated protein [freshwater metagenome]|uniref:Unannotated protein n=1 Tax=freshwater metagenome TaxID=449393 RepID=A0A6J6XW01_9ZZZZ